MVQNRGMVDRDMHWSWSLMDRNIGSAKVSWNFFEAIEADASQDVEGLECAYDCEYVARNLCQEMYNGFLSSAREVDGSSAVHGDQSHVFVVGVDELLFQFKRLVVAHRALEITGVGERHQVLDILMFEGFVVSLEIFPL